MEVDVVVGATDDFRIDAVRHKKGQRLALVRDDAGLIDIFFRTKRAAHVDAVQRRHMTVLGLKSNNILHVNDQ